MTITVTDFRLAAILLVVAACADPPAATHGDQDDHGDHDGGFAVTVWGDRYEVFSEIDAPAAGEAARAHVHVTRLDGFAPLAEGGVEVVLTNREGEHVFAADAPERPGVFDVELRPESPGEYDLAFRVRAAGGDEEIRGGRVRVGSAEAPGGLAVARVPRGATAGGEPVSFLKEEQWRSGFATAWVRPGRLARSVSGLARVRPPAGGESAVTATVDGVLHPPAGSGSWPYAGLRVERGGALFRVVPRVASERSLPALEAELAALEAERETALARLARLEELLELEATSRREVEEARTRVETLEARHDAARRDLEAARASRSGGAAGGLTLRAPFSGEIAAVAATPGATVAAGEVLARLVRTDAVWLEVALAPAAARQLAESEPAGVVLADPQAGSPLRLEEGLRLVSVAPELSARTGTVTALLEAPSRPGLTLGTTLEAQVLLAGEREGIVVPATALVDDGGIPVVYLQLAGESFVRQPVEVVERQGDRALVEGLVPGQRLVTRGGEAIRRSSLMGTGDPHGHVH